MEEVRHGLMDERCGGRELLRRTPAARPAERLPIARASLFLVHTVFCYVETTSIVVKRREVSELPVVVDRTVYSGKIRRSRCNRYSAPIRRLTPSACLH
jgi:hypothetical protein